MGPSFGDALRAWYEPFNGDNVCVSVSNQDEYSRIGVASSGASDLTQTTLIDGRYWFTISELEVWEVAFE